MRAKTRTGSGSTTTLKAGLRLLVLAFVLAAGALNAGAAAASPAPKPAGEPAAGVLASCNRTSCNGLEPQAAGCAGDAYNLYEYTFAGYRVEHRFSPACYATWTRATYVSGNAWSFRAYHESQTGGTSTVIQGVNWRGDTGWSNMYSFTSWSRSCAVSNTGSYCGDYR